MPAGNSTSFLEELRGQVSRTMTLRNLVSYATLVAILSVVSFLIPYQTQVYLSISSGITVALLLPVSMVLTRGFTSLDAVFIGGVLFLFVALFESDLPTRAVLENIRHLSLILSVVLTGLYVLLQVSLRSRVKSNVTSLKSFGGFFSVCSTTLSSELCSCLHPALFLEALGVVAFLPNQVRLGFVIMMATLVYQARSTFASYRSRRRSGSRAMPATGPGS